MFHDIPDKIQRQMRRLEKIDSADRIDGTPHEKRLRQIPPETGKFLALMAATSPAGKIIEIGTSAGYSSLYLSLACRLKNTKLISFENSRDKADLAKETFRLAGVENIVELVIGDARDHLNNCKDIAFCFLDADKNVYKDCYDLILPNMVARGLLIVDNVISHADLLRPFIDHALGDIRVDALIVPIGKGELFCRKL